LASVWTAPAESFGREVVCDVRQDVIGIAHIRPHDNGLVALGRQRLRVQGHHRFVVDIDDAGVRVGLLRDLARVRAGRQAGPDVEELPDPGIAEEPDRADQELAVAR
jgi:hypothetical protein